MRDTTVSRACRQGAKSTPVEGKPRRFRIYNNVVLTAEEIALAVEMARADRIERDIRAYAYKKGNQCNPSS